MLYGSADSRLRITDLDTQRLKKNLYTMAVGNVQMDLDTQRLKKNLYTMAVGNVQMCYTSGSQMEYGRVLEGVQDFFILKF